jgi:putative NADH-flavin reductase
VKQALEAGHEVTAYVRDPAKLGVTHQRLRVTRGDVRDAAAVAQAVAGQDAVLSALGPSKPDFNTLTEGARHILGGLDGGARGAAE